jgi:site-specific DNA-methyltransferase (adenine-specific)
MQTEITKENRIYCGDNLKIMREMESESVDLIYLDPPFFSGKNYEVIWKDGTEVRSFKDTEWYRVGCPNCAREVVKADRFCPVCGTDLKDAKVTRSNDIYAYIDWMVPRLTEMHRILAPNGSLYLHVDWHAVHYLKVEMDRIFGMKNFQNEIVWCYSGGGASKNKFARKHDMILFYKKTAASIFNTQYTKYKNPNGRHSGGTPYREEGKLMDDWWVDLPVVASGSKERLGYPTQKPVSLLERIINASSNPGDTIFDPFCGCGTTLAAAQKLGRSYIGIDISPTSCMVISDRINHFDRIIGMQYTDDEWMTMEPHEFQNIVCNALHAKNTSPDPSKASGADGGIDGIVKSELVTVGFAGVPIQIKRSKSVGVDTIKKLEATMQHMKSKPTIGIVVAVSFGAGAKKQAILAKELGLNIILIEAKDIHEFEFSAIEMLE